MAAAFVECSNRLWMHAQECSRLLDRAACEVQVLRAASEGAHGAILDPGTMTKTGVEAWAAARSRVRSAEAVLARAWERDGRAREAWQQAYKAAQRMLALCAGLKGGQSS